MTFFSDLKNFIFSQLFITVFIFLLIILALVCLNSSASKIYSKTENLMGTDVTITVVSLNEKQAYNAIDLAFAEMKTIESVMSIYNPESDLSNLNAFAQNNTNLFMKIDPQLYYVIEESIKVAEQTDGAFDITVNPILELWSTASKTKVFPTPEQISETLELVGSKHLWLSRESVAFKRPNMSINLGGIAKGYAVDRAIIILKSEGIQSALVDAGGDIRTFGTKPNKIPWTLALQNPRDQTDYITIIESEDLAVVTSGDYERYFDLENTRVTHIADPRSGYSAKGTMSVTIISQNVTFADALATGIFVLGKDGLNIVESIPDTEALLIDENRTIYRTSGFDDYEKKD